MATSCSGASPSRGRNSRRTWREVIDDDVLGLAAQLSYYFFLALFPAILFLLALASFFPLSNITDAIGLTLGVAVLVLVALSLVLVGPTLAEKLGQTTGWGVPFEWTWLVLQWPLVFGLVALGIGLLYYFGPDAEQDWVWITPGAVAEPFSGS